VCIIIPALAIRSKTLTSCAASRCCDGQLRNFDLRWFPESALTVVMAAKGYPGDYAKGTRIEGRRRDGRTVAEAQ
jgi:phosphoribosylamine-glycine ligase